MDDLRRDQDFLIFEKLADNDVQVDAGRGDEVLLDLRSLALAQQTVVDEHAGELVANRGRSSSRGLCRRR